MEKVGKRIRLTNMLKKYGLRGVNRPKMTPSHPTKKAIVLASENGQTKLLRFGAKGYGNNYSKEARKNYLSRSAGIKNGKTKLGRNYWARRFLWKAGGQVTAPTSQHPDKFAN